MKLFSLFTLFIGLSSSGVCAQDLHLVAPDSWSQQSLAPQGLEQRIQQAAVTYQGYGQIPRVAFFDIAFPADTDEYLALDGYAVLLVAAQSQSIEELPPRRVYVRLRQKTIELQLLASASCKTAPNSVLSKVFGPYRWEGLYLFPVFARLKGDELVMDFATNRTGFVLGRFEPASAETLAKLPVQLPSSAVPAYEPLQKIIVREFPGFVPRLSSIQMVPGTHSDGKRNSAPLKR
jgi:hypothetical protein